MVEPNQHSVCSILLFLSQSSTEIAGRVSERLVQLRGLDEQEVCVAGDRELAVRLCFG